MKKIIYLFPLLISLMVNAQKTNSMLGDYYLQNEREVASGFRLNADNTFEFFFSSGGIDRTGKGMWQLEKDILILNTPEKPLQNFRLVASKKIPGDSITIAITDKNKMILGYVHYSIKTGNDTIEGTTSDEGLAVIKNTPIQSIILSHELWPDKGADTFEITGNANNHFEFAMEKSISSLVFDNLKLTVKGNIITGGHPMMPDGKFTYQRN